MRLSVSGSYASVGTLAIWGVVGTPCDCIYNAHGGTCWAFFKVDTNFVTNKALSICHSSSGKGLETLVLILQWLGPGSAHGEMVEGTIAPYRVPIPILTIVGSQTKNGDRLRSSGSHTGGVAAETTCFSLLVAVHTQDPA